MKASPLAAMRRLACAHETRLLWLLLLAAALLRLGAVLALKVQPVSDYASYQAMALNLLQGRGLVDDMGNLAFYNAGYPLLVLAPAFALSGGSLFAAQLANVLLGVLSVGLVHGLARQAGAGAGARLLAAALWAVYLPSAVYGVYLAKENLMTPLMLGLMWCTLHAAQAPAARPRLFALAGLLIGLIALCGNAGLALLAAAPVALLLAPMGWPQRGSAAVLTLLVAALVVAPWMLRNQQRLGAPVLNTNGGFNLYLGNNPAADGMFVSIADTPRGPSWHALRAQGEVQAAEVLKQEALAWIRAHPQRFAELGARKLLAFWTPPLHAGQGQASAAETLLRRLWLLQFVVLVAAALIGAVLYRHRGAGLLWLGLVSYSAVHMLFYVIYRYREPVMPLLAVLAALGAQALWRRWACRA